MTAFLVLAFATSLAGGLLPSVQGLIARLGLPRVLAFRSGLLIAVACADVLPEAWRLSAPPAAAAALGALALGFALHGGGGEDHAGHEHTHPHVHPGDRAHIPATVTALFLHSLLDGVNLGSLALVGGPALWTVGAAITLHKFADGFTLTSLFHQTGHPRGRVLLLLIAASLATPAGAVLARAGELAIGPHLGALLLGFAGGSFLYVGVAQAWTRSRRGRDAGAAVCFGGGLAAMLFLHRLSS